MKLVQQQPFYSRNQFTIYKEQHAFILIYENMVGLLVHNFVGNQINYANPSAIIIHLIQIIRQ